MAKYGLARYISNRLTCCLSIRFPSGSAREKDLTVWIMIWTHKEYDLISKNSKVNLYQKNKVCFFLWPSTWAVGFVLGISVTWNSALRAYALMMRLVIMSQEEWLVKRWMLSPMKLCGGVFLVTRLSCILFSRTLRVEVDTFNNVN